MWSLWFRGLDVKGLGFGVCGLEFGVQGLGLVYWLSGYLGYLL